jgi:chromosomal replication initiation ATPase DnaA
MRQLGFWFPDERRYGGSDFVVAPSNETARTWVDRPYAWPDRRLALWGEAGCGKTHLLRLWADRVGALTISGSALRGLPDRLPPGGLAIDDADLAPNDRTLLHWLNCARDVACPVLLAARKPPSAYGAVLPDLVSRLRAFAAVEIGRAEDALLAELAKRLIGRYWRHGDETVEALLPVLPRTPGDMRNALLQTERRLLAEGGRVTAARLRKMLLGDISEPLEDAIGWIDRTKEDRTLPRRTVGK